MAMYTCDTVKDLLIRLSGQISDRIYNKGATVGPWQAGTPRGQWMDGMGTTQNNILWERTVPADNNGVEWQNVAVSDNISVDGCTITPEQVNFGQTERSMSLQKRHIQTQDICFEDLRSSFLFERFMGQLQNNLTFISQYVWDSRARDEYIRLSAHKVTENASFDLNATSFSGANPPTSRLTWGPLEQIYDFLEAEGAGMNGVSMGQAGTAGRPVFDLYTDGQSMRQLIRDDPELREDFRFAYEGQGINSPLLMTRGGQFTYNGYRFVNDSNVKRADVIGGVITYRPKYADPVAATKGVKQEVNPFWLYAQTQFSVVHIPAVYTQLVLATKGPIAGMPFEAVSWMGDFDFLVIKDKVCNPRGNKGFFDALFASASEPGLTHLGFVIWHNNCRPTLGLKPSCYS